MSAVQGVGSLFQGVFNRRAARRRSTLLKRDAAEALRLGAIRADLIETDRQVAEGRAVARQGASGFALDGGALAVIGALAADYGYQARNARYEAARTAASMRSQAAAERARGTLHLLKGVADAAGHFSRAIPGSASSAEGGSSGG